VNGFFAHIQLTDGLLLRHVRASAENKGEQG